MPDGYQIPVIDRFGGLDLSGEQADTGIRAISCSNVMVEPRGAVVYTRPGLETLETGAGAYARIARRGFNEAILYRNTGAAFALSQVSGGVVGAESTWGDANTLWTSDAALGTPTATYMFVATYDGTGATPFVLRRWNGAAVANSVGEPYFVAATPWDNRLAQASFTAAGDSPTGSNGSLSTVFFSDAGLPETYSANNYIHLRPGNGEVITGMVAWRDMLFVFKQTSMFVFYGVSVASDGTPIFNYREIALPSPLRSYSELTHFTGTLVSTTCRGDGGVYMLLNDGIYVTTGGTPVRISDRVSVLFATYDGGHLIDSGTSPLNDTGGFRSLSFAMGRLFVAGTNGMLVYDTRLDEWLHWTTADTASPFTNVIACDTQTTSSPYRQVLTVAAGTKLRAFSRAVTADGSTAIASHWQSTFTDHGSPVDKTLRKTVAWGIGAPTFKVSVDYATADAGAVLTLGTSPAIARGANSTSRKGTLHSYRFQATSGYWQVNRLEPNIHMPRVTGTS